jgi:subtilase family serine protease
MYKPTEKREPMKTSFRILHFVAILLLMLVLSPVAFATPTANHSTGGLPFLAINYQQVPTCKKAQRADVARCLPILLKRVGSQRAAAIDQNFAGLTPGELQQIYNLQSAAAGGWDQTLAIIDAYDDPKAEADMAIYRATFGLPPCTSANGCFKKVDERGGKHYPRADAGWASEIALDLDMVSAICPHCHILLVEADNAASSNLGQSVNTAVRLGATIVSNSYGIRESAQLVRDDAHYYNHPGVIITVSTGDNGYAGGVQFPADLPNVIAVGGTSVYRANNARGWTESAWSGTGSGCSRYVSKPSWQKDRGCPGRTVADISAVADPATGVAIYNTYQSFGTWFIAGGTSVSAPIIAGIYALAGNATQVTGSDLYNHAQDLNDVTAGSNGTCAIRYLCTAGSGYDGPTGLGTPDGIRAF